MGGERPNSLLPCDAPPDPNLPPILECTVLAISFQRFPKNSADANNTHILCEVLLGEFSDPNPFDAKLSASDRCTLKFHPANNDFLIPTSVYNLSLARSWVTGDRCRVAYWEQGSLKYYQGTIREKNQEKSFEISIE